LEAAIMMHKASQSVLRVSRACEQGLWQRSAMAMATKVDGGKNSAGGIDQGSPGANPAEREAFRYTRSTLIAQFLHIPRITYVGLTFDSTIFHMMSFFE